MILGKVVKFCMASELSKWTIYVLFSIVYIMFLMVEGNILGGRGIKGYFIVFNLVLIRDMYILFLFHYFVFLYFFYA